MCSGDFLVQDMPPTSCTIFGSSHRSATGEGKAGREAREWETMGLWVGKAESRGLHKHMESGQAAPWLLHPPTELSPSLVSFLPKLLDVGGPRAPSCTQSSS